MYSTAKEYYYNNRMCKYIRWDAERREYHFDIVGGAHLIISAGRENLIRDSKFSRY